ncbi:MAG: 23S rRNA (uracil(1939)-C(5))-methyltransferase RlmD [Verrucomicrobia subdivision 3 bacterium]|nr:23S rRNA (uracil(1939)-C(5))-methyltransferase RlmD [Limisphaerales bacterium]MCS1413956.1 23S rRNA (uracil(1939)-C(5))-methyltransferase RlmD [Limisphaerales bacterium]
MSDSSQQNGSDALPDIGATIQLEITDLAFGGEGVGHHNGLAIFVPFVAVGEQIRTEITEVKKNYARGKLVELIQSSPDRIEPRCPHFSACGGCQYQHLSYPVQQKAKYKQLVDIFQRIGGFPKPPIRPVVPCPTPYGYRNRILVRTQYSKATKRMSIGFLRHDNRLVVDVEECYIAEPFLNQKLQKVRTDPPRKNGIKSNLRLMPEDWILPPDSFFQVNYHLLPKMVTTVKQYLQSSGSTHLLDVYCGAGFFCLKLASDVTSFTGIEIDKKAVQAARENAKTRHCDNGEFIALPAEVAIPKIISKFTATETTVILDPPRKGCDSKLLDSLLQHQPQQLIYVSCHPATLCRDLAALCSEGKYLLRSVTPLDMFPQTKHIECVCDLRCGDPQPEKTVPTQQFSL